MNRADFWVRVLGWLQLAGGAAVAATIFLAIRIIDLSDVPPIAAQGIPALLFIFIGLPEVLAGVLCLRFAGHVQAAREGRDTGEHALLRVALGLAGLWAAGVVGLFGFAAPHLGFFSLLGLITAVLGVIGAPATANLIRPAA